MTPINESVVEQAALAWLESLGYAILYGPEIAPDEASAARDHYGQVVLERWLRHSLQRLNPQVPADALEVNDNAVKVLCDETLRIIAYS